MNISYRKTIGLILLLFSISFFVYKMISKIKDSITSSIGLEYTLPKDFQKIIKQNNNNLTNIKTKNYKYRSPISTFEYKGSCFFITSIGYLGEKKLSEIIQIKQAQTQIYAFEDFFLVKDKFFKIMYQEGPNDNYVSNIDFVVNRGIFSLSKVEKNMYSFNTVAENVMLKYNGHKVEDVFIERESDVVQNMYVNFFVRENRVFLILNYSSSGSNLSENIVKEILN